MKYNTIFPVASALALALFGGLRFRDLKRHLGSA